MQGRLNQLTVKPGRHIPRAAAGAVLAALLIAAPALSATAAPVSTTSASVGVSSARQLAAAEKAIARTAEGAALSSADRRALATRFVGLASDIKSHQSAPGMVRPDWSIGLGWHIYLHHLTPSDQRWFMNVGAIVVGGVICAASGFDPAVCLISGVAAAVIVETVSEYYSPKYCVEIQLNYSGSLHKAYRTRC